MTYDVVIVGGGPSGLASAIEVARRGLSVHVFERSCRPMDGPGETLHAHTASVLHHLGVEQKVARQCLGRTSGIWTSILGSPISHQQFDPSIGRGFHIRRSTFNRILAERALEVGAQVTYGASVQSLDFVDEDICIGVQMSHDKSTRFVTARCLIDASGKVGWSARRLNTKPGYRSKPIALRYGWEDAPFKRCVDPLFIQRKDGWIWKANLGDGRLAWVERGGQHKKGAGADGTWFISSRAVEGKILRVGDAVCRVDPSIGHGVARALLSGVSVGGIATEMCSNQGQKSESYIQLKNQYCEWITQSFVQDAKVISQFTNL